MKCVACKVAHVVTDPSTAFVAGIAFVAQHNNDAVVRLLCEAHLAMLDHAAKSAAHAILVADRRTP